MAESDKRSPVFDWEKGDFVKDNQNAVATVTGSEAVKQITLKALNTVRGIYAIYADLEDPDLHHKYGSDVESVLRQNISEDFRIEELRRAVVEALVYDPWILEVYDVDVSRVPDSGLQGEAAAGYISLKIRTIFDTEINLEGVELNG